MRVLTVNTGSSSLRSGLYGFDDPSPLLFSAQAEGVGSPRGRLRARGPGGGEILEEPRDFPDHVTALRAVLTLAASRGPAPDAIGHRVVHGGESLAEPCLVTADLLATLEGLAPLAPDHLPQALLAIRLTGDAYPGVPQVACFDTAFHRTMPPRARRYPLPGSLEAQGILRYGFHGLSCESILNALRREAPAEAQGRLIVAHLGNGASLTAVRDGESIETTMGFTPAGGIMMGTRSGDLDPGVLIYLMRTPGMSPADVDALVNRQAGLLGVSGTTGDMRELLERQGTDRRAAMAIDLFCYHARKQTGALAAVLGGVDTLIFTGGIGEHAAAVRSRVCDGLGFLGIRLDERRNAEHAALISREGAGARVRVIASDEDLVIARHACEALGRPGRGTI